MTTPQAPAATFDAAEFSVEREKLIAEARKLLADAPDGGALDEAATARFSEIEKRLETMSAEAAAVPAVVDPTTRPVPGASPVRAAATRPPHPLAFTASALDRIQLLLDSRESGRVRASTTFAALTTGTYGAPRAWGANVLDAPRLLSEVAGIPRDPVDAVLAQFPQLTLPTAQPVTAEGAALVEYASSAAGSVTLGRFGRWTDLTKESLIGADAGAITAMHRVGIALDLDKVLIDAVEAAAGAAVGFNADVPAQIRKAIAKVMAATATDDPAHVVVLANPDDVHLLEDVAPTGGQTIGERFQRFSGALVYPSTAVNTGFITVAQLRAGARYFEARGLETLTDSDVKTGVETTASFIVGGYGVTLTGDFAVMQDVVTP